MAGVGTLDLNRLSIHSDNLGIKTRLATVHLTGQGNYLPLLTHRTYRPY